MFQAKYENMQIKIMKTVIPVISGGLFVLGLLILLAFIRNEHVGFLWSDFLLFGGLAVIAMIIQITLALPIWEKYRIKNIFLRLDIFSFTGIISLIGGIVFGIIFWDPMFGIKDLVTGSLYCIIAFIVYWTVNIYVLKLIGRKI